MIIPYIWENKKCSKPPTRQYRATNYPAIGVPSTSGTHWLEAPRYLLTISIRPKINPGMAASTQSGFQWNSGLPGLVVTFTACELEAMVHRNNWWLPKKNMVIFHFRDVSSFARWQISGIPTKYGLQKVVRLRTSILGSFSIPIDQLKWRINQLKEIWSIQVQYRSTGKSSFQLMNFQTAPWCWNIYLHLHVPRKRPKCR